MAQENSPRKARPAAGPNVSVSAPVDANGPSTNTISAPSNTNNTTNTPTTTNFQNKAVNKASIDRVLQQRNTAAKIGLKCLPDQTKDACDRKGGKFTMILAGCRGTGKSTFLNTLIGESLAKETKDRIDGQVRTRRYSLVESKFDLDLTVVDMPDFAANIDNQYTWLPIVKYIESQFRQYLLQEEQPRRELLTDSRVHVCVYFISPTNTELSTLDIESMKEISKRVTLIPVIARSDTLNKEELVHFKGIINRTLQDNEIDISKYLQHESVAEKLAQHAPYAIIGSNTMYKNADGNFVRARKYGWAWSKLRMQSTATLFTSAIC